MTSNAEEPPMRVMRTPWMLLVGLVALGAFTASALAQTPGGAFSQLSAGQQKIARALFEAQPPRRAERSEAPDPRRDRDEEEGSRGLGRGLQGDEEARPHDPEEPGRGRAWLRAPSSRDRQARQGGEAREDGEAGQDGEAREDGPALIRVRALLGLAGASPAPAQDEPRWSLSITAPRVRSDRRRAA